MAANQNLKALRHDRNVTVRDVELASRRIAEARGDKRFYISNARLTQLENDPSSEPGIWKLSSLSAIYRVKITDLMRLYNVDSEEGKFNAIAVPGTTCLLSDVPPAYLTIEALKSLVKFPDKTTLLPTAARAADDKPDLAKPHPCSPFIGNGYIGLNDFTMYPLIRPGSFVELDTRQSKLQLIAWRSQYDRPIYFVELRDGYSCSWCELQGNQLLIIPHHSSHASVRRFIYPKEAEIVGRVVRFSTSCVDEGFINMDHPEISPLIPSKN